MLDTEEMLRRRASIGAFAEIVANDGQCLKPARADRVQMMMPEGELPVAPFDARAGTRKEVRAFSGDAFVSPPPDLG